MFKKSSKKGAIRKRKVSEEDETPVDNSEDNDGMDKLKLARLKRDLLQKKAGVSSGTD